MQIHDDQQNRMTQLNQKQAKKIKPNTQEHQIESKQRKVMIEISQSNEKQ